MSLVPSYATVRIEQDSMGGSVKVLVVPSEGGEELELATAGNGVSINRSRGDAATATITVLLREEDQTT